MQWYRSLYWRIAFGFVAVLAAMLVVQAMLFVWAVSQSARNVPGQSPARLAMNVALDLSNVLERDPQADLVAALFCDGVSTRRESTAISGRGVGLGALQTVVRELGGKCEIESAANGGTTFRFILPESMLDDVAASHGEDRRAIAASGGAVSGAHDRGGA